MTETDRTVDAVKLEKQRCYSCPRTDCKTTYITTKTIPGGIHLCNKCLQWLKNKLRGF